MELGYRSNFGKRHMDILCTAPIMMIHTEVQHLYRTSGDLASSKYSTGKSPFTALQRIAVTNFISHYFEEVETTKLCIQCYKLRQEAPQNIYFMNRWECTPGFLITDYLSLEQRSWRALERVVQWHVAA